MTMKTILIFLIFFNILLVLQAVHPDMDHHDTDEHHDADDHHKDDHHKDHRPDDPDISTPFDHYDKSGHHDEGFDHDAVTGSHHETEEFKDLEPEEAKRRLGLLFNRMDKNMDTNVSHEELFDWIMQSFKNLDIEDSSAKLHDFDDNNDKKVSWDEFVSKTYGHSEKEIADMEKTSSDDMKTFLSEIHLNRKKFQLADKDKDNILDLLEFTAFSHPHNYPEMASYELARTLEDFDKNKDGKIDIKEFLGDEKMDNDTETHERKSFMEYDRDQNGVLEGSEITSWTMPGFDKTAHSEVEHLFNETDVNKDKVLSKEEVVNQHDLWVGSHATDYGKHLDDMKVREEL